MQKQKDTMEQVGRALSVLEFVQAKRDYDRCLWVCTHFNRADAERCLQDMIRKYHDQINLYGVMKDGCGVLYGPICCQTDADLIKQIWYIAQHILDYYIIHETEKGVERAVLKLLNR